MRHVVGPKDIIMMPSIVDVAGIDRISARVYANAAGAIAGMLGVEPPVSGQPSRWLPRRCSATRRPASTAHAAC